MKITMRYYYTLNQFSKVGVQKYQALGTGGAVGTLMNYWWGYKLLYVFWKVFSLLSITFEMDTPYSMIQHHIHSAWSPEAVLGSSWRSHSWDPVGYNLAPGSLCRRLEDRKEQHLGMTASNASFWRVQGLLLIISSWVIRHAWMGAAHPGIVKLHTQEKPPLVAAHEGSL